MIRKLFVLIAVFLVFPPLLQAKEDRIADVVDVVSKAIVNIRTEELAKRGAAEGKSGDILKRIFSRDSEDDIEMIENIGSGVVLDPKGIIVTNEHLVSRAVTIRVKFTNRQEYDANVIAADPEMDIALLKVEGEDFPFLKAQKKSVRVGQRAIVIGNPYGLSSSVTTGVVSALGRNLKINNRIYADLIQTDAAINPGSSGGALLDAEGSLLGIVTAIYEEGKGIGFAIPINDVMTMVSEFLQNTGQRALFGMFVEKRKDEDDNSFLYVNRVLHGSPAEKYGMRAGDRIVELDSRKIREGTKLQNMFRKAAANGRNQLKVVRGSEMLSITVENMPKYVPDPLEESLCGLRLSDIEGYVKLKFKLRQKNGVVVTKVMRGGIGERYGLKTGDLILKINNADVSDKRSFRSLMVEGLRRNYILYQVKRNDNVFFLPIKLDTLL